MVYHLSHEVFQFWQVANTYILIMDKFCLKWNDFQQNASKSFNILRKEKDFLDVTLVSDDGHHISAHKVVLSASSKFFKDCLKKSSHPNPMIFLPGSDLKVLTAILDYIYEGEVQLLQEEINAFLDTAEKLKIEGLVSHSKEEGMSLEKQSESKNFGSNDISLYDENKHSESLAPLKDRKIVSVDDDIVETINSSFDTIEGGFKCNRCGKISTKKSNMKQHVELHIEGLSFKCQYCPKTFRSSNVLNNHRNTFHKKF